MDIDNLDLEAIKGQLKVSLDRLIAELPEEVAPIIGLAVQRADGSVHATYGFNADAKSVELVVRALLDAVIKRTDPADSCPGCKARNARARDALDCLARDDGSPSLSVH